MKRIDVKVSRMLTDGKTSRARKYQELVIGRQGAGALIKYELITLLSSWVPGVLGLFLRSKLYPLLLGGAGRRVVFGANVVLRHPHKIFIGDDVIIDDNCMLDAKGASNKGIFIGNNVFIGRNSIVSCKDGDVRLEDGVNIGFNCEIYSSSAVVVGRDTLIAAYSYLIGGGNYDVERQDVTFVEQDGLNSRGIHIEPNNWIGAGVKILDGVRIGSGSVVGAGAVVLESIPANAVAAGLPARVVRLRPGAEEPAQR